MCIKIISSKNPLRCGNSYMFPAAARAGTAKRVGMVIIYRSRVMASVRRSQWVSRSAEKQAAATPPYWRGQAS